MTEQIFPKRPLTDNTAESGIIIVSSIINDEYGWIFKRNPQEYDYGVDGFLDFVNDEGSVTGKYCSVQLKTGKSYLKSSDEDCYWYTDTEAHLNYFSNLPTPHLLLLCDPESKICFWARFDEKLVESAGSGWKHPVMKSNLLDLDSKIQIEAIINESANRGGWDRAPDELKLRTDGKYEFGNVAVSSDAWTMSNDVTCVKLNFSAQPDGTVDPVIGAVNSVKAYLASVGARGQYMHALLLSEDSKLKRLSSWCPTQYRQQFNEWFLDNISNMEWFVEKPHMQGKYFDWIACNVKGTGEWSLFFFDITAFYVPEALPSYEA